MTDWLIVYYDGSTFSSDDGGPEDAPRWGVQVIAKRDEDVGRVLVWMRDFYCWQEGQWVGHDSQAADDYERETKWPIRLRGYEIDRKRFYSEIYPQAYNDPRLPPKTARHAQEQQPEE